MRTFAFIYRFKGEDYGMTVEAEDIDEARERLKTMSLARYHGEVHVSVPRALSFFGIVPRILMWLRKPEDWGKRRY